MKTRVKAVIEVPLDIDDEALGWLSDYVSDGVMLWAGDQPENVSYNLHFEREEIPA